MQHRSHGYDRSESEEAQGVRHLPERDEAKRRREYYAHIVVYRDLPRLREAVCPRYAKLPHGGACAGPKQRGQLHRGHRSMVQDEERQAGHAGEYGKEEYYECAVNARPAQLVQEGIGGAGEEPARQPYEGRAGKCAFRAGLHHKHGAGERPGHAKRLAQRDAFADERPAQKQREEWRGLVERHRVPDRDVGNRVEVREYAARPRQCPHGQVKPVPAPAGHRLPWIHRVPAPEEHPCRNGRRHDIPEERLLRSRQRTAAAPVRKADEHRHQRKAERAEENAGYAFADRAGGTAHRRTVQDSFTVPLRTAMKALCGTLTCPNSFIRALPRFCFSSTFILRVTSPP